MNKPKKTQLVAMFKRLYLVAPANRHLECYMADGNPLHILVPSLPLRRRERPWVRSWCAI
jgi:hypothetical protein